MVSPVQKSDKALGGVRGQIEDGDPGERRKLDSQGDPGGMRWPRREERALESRGRPQRAEGKPWGQSAQSRGQMEVPRGIRFSRGWGLQREEDSGRWRIEAGEEGSSRRWTGQEHGGGSEGWKAQPGGLRRLPRAEWLREHQGVPYSCNPSGGSSLGLILRKPMGGGSLKSGGLPGGQRAGDSAREGPGGHRGMQRAEAPALEPLKSPGPK